MKDLNRLENGVVELVATPEVEVASALTDGSRWWYKSEFGDVGFGTITDDGNGWFTFRFDNTTVSIQAQMVGWTESLVNGDLKPCYTPDEYDRDKEAGTLPIGIHDAAWVHQDDCLHQDPNGCRLEGEEAVYALLDAGWVKP